MPIKHGFYALLLILTGCVMGSCLKSDFLDETKTTDLDREVVFSDRSYTVGFLYEIYQQIGFDTDLNRFSTWNQHSGLQSACDEAEFKASSEITTDALFATGTVNPVIVTDDAWKKCYENIRRVNVFLNYVDRSPISASNRLLYKAEARFLRSWYYFILLRHYGGIPLIGDDIYDMDDPRMKTTRDTYATCVDYIVDECVAAAAQLPNRYTGRDQGRIDAGTCKALISRVYLYAASKLHNGSDFVEDPKYKELLGYPTYDRERWKLAMDAATDVMSLGYELFVAHTDRELPAERGLGFYWLFMAADRMIEGAYCGTIFELKAGTGRSRYELFQPPSRNGNCAGGYPYQELVDAFPMKNGKSISDPTSSYDPEHPYKDRDPRFNNTITHDQSLLQNGGTPNVPVNILLNEDGSAYDQDAIYSGTPTGYYFRKMQHRSGAANHYISTPHSRPLIRYAEILLNYAEAANEYDGPSDEIYTALKDIRERAGIEPGDDGMYGLKKNMNYDEMAEAIQLERRIELALEGHRFWDVRRWMIAKDVEDKTLTGMEIKLSSAGKVYKRVNVRKHVFRDAMYFWPLPYKEVSKSPSMLQNPYY